MTVSKLISLLLDCNPESEVETARDTDEDGYEWCKIDGIDRSFEEMEPGKPALVLIQSGEIMGC